MAGIGHRGFMGRNKGNDPLYNNLQLWLDALDAATFTLTGSDVDVWADKSIYGRDCTPKTSAKPIKGADYVSFNRSSFSLSRLLLNYALFPDGCSFFLVHRRTANPVGVLGYFLRQNAPSAAWGMGQAVNRGSYQNSYWGIEGGIEFGSADNTFDTDIHILNISMYGDGGGGRYANRSVYLDGSILTFDQPQPTVISFDEIGGLSINYDLSFVGDFMEIRAYDRLLTPTERTALTSELMTKWSI